MIRRLGILLLVGFVHFAWAGDCRKTGEVCVDSSPTKVVSGVTVSLASVGGCWEWEDSYTCLKPNAINFCEPLSKLSQCWQTNSQCAQTDTMFGTGCMLYTQTYRCGDPSLPAPTNTVKLDSSYTLVQDSINSSACSSYTSNPRCNIASHVCVQGPETRNINGMAVYKDCWQWQDTYTCVSPNLESDCQEYVSQGCTLTNSTCINSDSAGCNLYDKTYSCLVSPPKTTTTNECSTSYCSDGKCFSTGNPPDNDIGTVITMMEAMREAGTYIDPNSLRVFNGSDDRCRVKLFGFVNCCKKSSGGASFSNSAMFNAGVKVAGETLDVGSAYVYDALQGSQSIQQGLGAALGMTGADGLFNPSFSFYGFNIQFSLANGFQLVSFDPYSLALQVGLMVLNNLLSCRTEEQLLSMKRGQNLCRSIGSYCSQKINVGIGKICVEKTQTYCCYNSRLARIINEQGRPQLGMDWGSPENPNCLGFTTAQLQALDFGKMDLSEFIAEIVPKSPNVSAITSKNQDIINQKVKDYYNQ